MKLLGSLDDETLLNLMMDGMTSSGIAELEPVVTLPSGLSMLYGITDMTDYDEVLGPLFGVCPVFMVYHDGKVLFGMISNYGDAIGDDSIKLFKNIIYTVSSR